MGANLLTVLAFVIGVVLVPLGYLIWPHSLAQAYLLYRVFSIFSCEAQ